jgi:gluconate 2-dehydrogenase gamma chain
MDNENGTRRQFLIRSVAGLSSTWLALHWPAVLAAQDHAHRAAESPVPVPLQFLSAEQAAEIEAATAQIIPTDDTPGAREAQVIHFVDRALMTFDRDKQSFYTQGLRDLQSKTQELFPGPKRFSELTSAQQVQVLEAIEKTDFFELLRLHTIMGFLASPEYGGNYNQVGWKVIGFEDRHVFSPPFGYYDAEYNKGH